jgi:replicative DNA helicase
MEQGLELNEIKGPWSSYKKAEPKDVTGWMKEIELELKSTKDLLAKERMEALMRDYNGDDKVIPSTEILLKMKNAPPEDKYFTGWDSLDAILGGFRKKQLIVISGPTKNGKTAWVMDLVGKLKEQKPMILPLEEPAEELLQKYIDRKQEAPLFYTPERTKSYDMKWVEHKIIEAKIKFGSQVFFIDHSYFVVQMATERQDMILGNMMRELKRMAKQWDVTIFLVHHLKKTKLTSAPDLEDLRDSSFIAQEADTVILIWRKTQRQDGEVNISDEAIISVQANRRTGKTGNITLKFDNGRFLEVDKDHEDNIKRKENSNEFASAFFEKD